MSGIAGDLPNIKAENLRDLKALTFDVFGTVVDWRSSVVEELTARARAKLDSSTNTTTGEEKEKLETLAAVDWSAFAQEWRTSYMRFTRGYVPGETPWKDIDTHHHDSLVALLEGRGLAGVYSDDEVRHLSLAWHRLRPWADSAAGLRRLGGKFVTSTLSNGNKALLGDLDAFGGLGFRRILSAEDWRVYKPNPAVYDGAVEVLVGGAGGKAREVAMVAAHLGDLAAARGRGMRTVYVERPLEEDWEVGSERYEDAKGWVDIWVKEGEGGFEEVARRLGA
ncbi:haloacid dehalogenase [Colletotrichum orchidophilum]|uniref:Haloacid dehalogenase n=1 Tax=Colletotrichum orchidophilum TaxID=1209926 RepID=A0A1G4AMW4_9PEZI|nr:haloacid dehalogenase [Colletotrichum orchidophilum]OHE90461.1 haloacid dehalogenase [Colletotrichum orchidophilum]